LRALLGRYIPPWVTLSCSLGRTTTRSLMGLRSVADLALVVIVGSPIRNLSRWTFAP
jgi:hypothetical protein